MEHAPDWPIRMTARIGERVARMRAERKMTVQALADKCEELGVPLGRVTLTKLEGGKRQAITPAELAVLAAALDAAPIELLYPVGYDDKVEILPGCFVDPLDAVGWFCGELKLERAGDTTSRVVPPPSDRESGVYLLQLHRDTVANFLTALEQAALAFERAMGPDADEHSGTVTDFHRTNVIQARSLAQRELRRTRSDMRRRGMMLPDLPPALGLDEGQDARGTRAPDHTPAAPLPDDPVAAAIMAQEHKSIEVRERELANWRSLGKRENPESQGKASLDGLDRQAHPHRAGQGQTHPRHPREGSRVLARPVPR